MKGHQDKSAQPTGPNPHFPYTLSWQHQNNELLRAIITTDPLERYKDASKALTSLHKKAHAAPALSITDTAVIPPSGDKRDFLSYAPYWWPDPVHPDGPWILKDGKTNPDTLQLTQQTDLTAAIGIMRIEALAELFLGPSTYGLYHVVHQLRVWFVQPSTRMNPNVLYGQVIRNQDPSLWTGRFEGILSVRYLAFIPSLVELVRSNCSLWRTKKDDTVMVQWCEEYLTWLLDPPFKAGTNTSNNNHRSYWACQVVEFQRFLGKHEDVISTLCTFVNTYLPLQINPDGYQRLEAHRTRPIHYALFNLDALVYLASFSEQLHPESKVRYYAFWEAQDHAIKRALDFLLCRHTLDDVEVQDLDMLHRLITIISHRYGDEDGIYAGFLNDLGPYKKKPYQLTPLFLSPSPFATRQ
ncbi:MAG: alginate lyase-domain-containing protein [Piptocephalis tieghemiana]|nr:MAG: alginate lyase-domain-containing protein [Piptocephalis tieghemiana]